jgi:pyruvate, orthophosphate dikinase
MVNADTPADALTGRNNGAEGIGLCRTEHMVQFNVICSWRICVCLILSIFFLLQFFSSDARIKAMRQMIMADTAEQRQKALDLLLPYQRMDFEGIFRAMDGK